MLRYSDISVERNFRLIDESVENFTTECDNMISSFDDRCNKALNSGFAFEAVEELDFYEEGAKEIIEGIGKKVIELFEKLIDAAKNFVTNIQAKLFTKKNSLEKVEAVIKKHPELAKEISTALEKDGLGVTEWKNIKDAEENISKILEGYAKGTIGKEDAEKKKDDELKRLKTKMDIVNSGIKIAGTVITVAGAIAFFRHAFYKNMANSENSIRSIENEYKGNQLAIAKIVKDNLTDTKHGANAVQKSFKVDTDGAIKDNPNAKYNMNIDRRLTDVERMDFAWHSQLIQIANSNLKNFAKLTRICSGLITAFSRRHHLYEDDVNTVFDDSNKAVTFNNAIRDTKKEFGIGKDNEN